MKLKQTEYKTIEVAKDEECGMVIGNIVMDGDNMLYAEITDVTIYNHEELANIRAFLDEVDEAMETETVYNILNRCCDTEMLPDNFWNILRRKDAIIKQHSNTIEDRDRTIDLMAKKHANRKAHIHNLENTIEKLKDQNIEDLNSDIDVKDKMLEKYRREIVGLRNMHDVVWDNVHALEDELSARKEDSDVLMKVVEAIKPWGLNETGSANTVVRIYDLVKDCLDSGEASNGDEDNTSYTVKMGIRYE